MTALQRPTELVYRAPWCAVAVIGLSLTVAGTDSPLSYFTSDHPWVRPAASAGPVESAFAALAAAEPDVVPRLWLPLVSTHSRSPLQDRTPTATATRVATTTPTFTAMPTRTASRTPTRTQPTPGPSPTARPGYPGPLP